MDGIVGIYGPGDNDLVAKTFLATGACQHRGKASTGLAVGNSKGIYIYKGLGRIADVIDHNLIRTFQDLEPTAAIGNIGYTKRKIAEKTNSEPIEIIPKLRSKYSLAITMDGYLIKEDDLKAELEGEYSFQSANKTEVVGAFLHKYICQEGISFDAGKRVLDKLRGRATFALTALVHDGKDIYLLALNDPKAFEPFCCATIDGAFVASSESCSHRRLHGFTEKEYDGAEMTICSPGGTETKRLIDEPMMPDIFQGVYFGNVASMFRGKEIFQIRRELGLELTDYYGKSSADIVIPNPESGWGVTVGIAEGLKKQLFPALIKLPQAVRTFQEGKSDTRSKEVGLKFGGVDSLLSGKNIAMGDDSIVRGSVSEGGSVWVVYNAGARYIEFWISYGPMFFPSFKEWHRGEDCLHELAVQRAFKDDNPYDKTLDEINKAVAKLVGVNEVRYNVKERIQRVAGDGSFQALDASYPIEQEFWPDWLKRDVEKFLHYRQA
ncbi:putative Amidophosphoribosyltransferase [uncultured Desulfobacterium sp.]|uniref:Putative Amidophosphoribosyltransferase n=1 Tax=uncultured Desulfobacterium sp. TaxID=201089 RepID=A0A445N194_9BACT|nr:putative Amidophosphoribosyltransferase [uncultured Desulfobacterium sp.]